MIYLDNAATTKVFDCAIEAAEACMREHFYNPNATYGSGVSAKSRIERDRRTIADAVGADPSELVFTSCATESNNWVIGCARKRPNGNVVISAGEHSSVYELAIALRNRGIDVRIVPLTSSGSVDIEAFKRLTDKNTTLVSVIHVSNETGIVNPVKELVGITRKSAPNAIFHSDGVQGLLKAGEPISSLGVDLYSASAHKLGAPKGIGLLYIRRGINIQPFMYGGGQERGMRSGTQNTPFISAFAAAVGKFAELNDSVRISAIRNELAEIFTANDCEVIGCGKNSGYILSVCVPNVKAEILQNAVHDKGVVIGKGAACSGSKRGNRVLSAMGLSQKQIENCVRISLFSDTSRDDAVSAARIILDCAEAIRSGHVG